MTKEVMSRKLKWYKIPESEYSLNGVKQNDYIYIEQTHDAWSICHIKGEKKSVLGTLYCEEDANNYLYYLVMKRHLENTRKMLWKGCKHCH